jgi:PKHD-type hydroxylase
MLVEIPALFTPAEAAEALRTLQAAEWTDGRVTAGHQSAQVKQNLQIAEGSPVHQALGDAVLSALGRSSLFISAVLPQRVFPPLFNRYDVGMTFGAHVDNAIRQIRGTPHRIRTDVSCTLFLTPPEDYDGGELVVQDTYGEQRVKLPAGHAVVYPSTSLHRVEPVTRGSRISSFFWIQSMVRDDTRRRLLFDLDMAINATTPDLPEGHDAPVALTGVYHNLLRQWAEVA